MTAAFDQVAMGLDAGAPVLLGSANEPDAIRILLIGDGAIDRGFLANELSEQGFAVQTVTSLAGIEQPGRLADTVAALTGTEYGKHGYTATGATKSMEGSIAFFSVAFFSVNVALVVFSDAGRIETLLISLNIALIVMLLEAIAWRGLDNIFIPLGVFITLRLYLAMPLGQLWDRFRVGMALVIFVTLYARKTTLQGSALLASALVLYISWALGGWQWLLPPAILLLAYTFFFPGKKSTNREKCSRQFCCRARHRANRLRLLLYMANGVF